MPQKKSAAASPAADAAPAADTTPDEDATPDGTAAEEPSFLNRAERRAKGKKAQAQNLLGKGPRLHDRGGFSNPRQYGNRRSG
ncbi:MAG: hypothetical protein WCA46_04180 [Actinocatenispora sp.]